MIKVLKEIRPDWFLIELEGTRYYQIWNKWELFQALLDYKTTSAQTLWDEDFPMAYSNLENITDYLDGKLKENNTNKLNKLKELDRLKEELSNLQTKIKQLEDDGNEN